MNNYSLVYQLFWSLLHVLSTFSPKSYYLSFSPYPAALRFHSWLCTQGSHLCGTRKTTCSAKIEGVKPRLVPCKTETLPYPTISLVPPLQDFTMISEGNTFIDKQSWVHSPTSFVSHNCLGSGLGMFNRFSSFNGPGKDTKSGESIRFTVWEDSYPTLRYRSYVATKKIQPIFIDSLWGKVCV